MSLQAGDKLGPYEILAPIGAGGMGEVYRARDTKLDREVAIKVLPAALAQDPERLARFEREAKVLASLNHPHIAQIYGIEESNGVRALVMELVPGQTLKGPLPLETALNYAKQIADALEAAHEKGITHRDLKPANIMITPQGVVKVLDFGLAKAAEEPAAGAGNASISPTLTLAATNAGVIIGTAAYMSPEQASGKPVDKRADIWAFGVVLWEMLTGRRLFDGETISHTLAAVLTKEPDLQHVSSKVRRLLQLCLQKDVRRRLQAIGDWQLLLEQPAEDVRPESRLGWLAWAVAGLLALALGIVSYRHAREEPPRVAKVSVLPPEKATFPVSNIPMVSPDGRQLAFVATVDGKDQLWVRDLDSLTARQLTGTDGASYPFWSPDSRSVGFFADRKLKRIEVAGGPALTLCDVGLARGGSWSKNDVILYGSNTGGINRVPAAGGSPLPATKLDYASSGETSHRFPWFLPDGHHFLYTTSHLTLRGNSVIYVADLDSKDRKLLVTADSNAVYTPPGYLLFVRERTLMAQPFDAGKRETAGDAFPIAEQVDSTIINIQKQFSASQNGVLVYISGGAGGEQQLAWIDRSGKTTSNAGPPGIYNNFRLAPDEKRIAFDRSDTQQGVNVDVWVMDLARGVISRLTFDSAVDNLPIWSPDGLRILYPNNRTGTFDLYLKAASGAGQEELLIKLGTPTGWGTHWSQDGRFIMYEMPGDKTRRDLWIAPQFGDRKPFPYLKTQFNEMEGNFSPDGRWVAYISDESGRPEIYVQAFPLSGAKFQISTGGGTEPAWRKDGSELFYLALDRNVMAVPIKSGATLEVGVAKSLFVAAVNLQPGQRHSYAVTNDGQRFLVSTSVGGEKTVPITVVLNWTAALKK